MGSSVREPLDPDHRAKLPATGMLQACAGRWEELFFLMLFALLCFQVLAFVVDTQFITSFRVGPMGLFARFEFINFRYLSYVIIPLVVPPLLYLAARRGRPRWARRYLDAVGVYIVARMFVQLIGLNLLVFDFTSSRFVLITQLLIFLPYSLFVWGWLYWRIDMAARGAGGQFFRVDCDREIPRPIDYLIASFSSVFSASISAIKGRSAKARALILVHGFFIYNVMGLTLSRAIALLQMK